MSEPSVAVYHTPRDRLGEPSYGWLCYSCHAIDDGFVDWEAADDEAQEHVCFEIEEQVSYEIEESDV
jgi:hypothetical protein